MTRRTFEALDKAKKQEATARAAKRKAFSAMDSEFAAAVRKYFPELVDGKTVNGKTVPVVDDVDKFFEKVARVYHASQHPGESSTGHQQDAGNPQRHRESSHGFQSTGYPQGASTVERQ